MLAFDHLRNRTLAIASYLRGDAIVPHDPLALEIEATNRCYEECLMCPRRFMKRPLGDLDSSLLQTVLSQCKHGPELVNLFHAGEPLLHPHLGELISQCKAQGVRVLITTTGALLTAEKGRELIESGLDMLVFSLDAATPLTYRQIRKHSRYETVIHNIERFLKLKARLKHGPFVQVQMVNLDINRQEAQDFLEQWRPKVDSVRIKRFYNTANIAATIGQSVPGHLAAKPLPCFMLWREPVICWDGTVLPCCVDLIGEAPLGNVLKQPLADIWNGPAMVEMRRLHAAGRYQEIELCRNCTIFQFKWPFVLGSLLFDDLTIRKVSPIVERLDTVGGHRQVSYF